MNIAELKGEKTSRRWQNACRGAFKQNEFTRMPKWKRRCSV